MAVIEVRYCSGPFYGLQLAPPVVTSVEEMSAPAIVTTRSSFPAAKDASKISENADYIVRLQEEGIPELEDEGGNRVANWKNGNLAESEDDFNKPYKETLVHVFKNQYALPVENTFSCYSMENIVSFFKKKIENIVSSYDDSYSCNFKNEREVNGINTNQNCENPAVATVTLARSSSYMVKDLESCMTKVETLSFWVTNSGKGVPNILEDKLQCCPLLPEEIAHGSKASNFLRALFACCRDDVRIPESSPQAEIKYLTWHRSVSSQLSPSRNPFGTNDGICTSTLDRLYAWESKLYDEIKASSAIYRRYVENEKCKKLRHQESIGDNQIAIGFTRASVKDLHSRVLVSVQKIDFISKKIEDLRDKDLQPELDELIECLTRMWATMLECHRRQCVIIKLVLPRRCNLKISSQSESQCHVVSCLIVEFKNLCSNFKSWKASHRAYLHSLKLWLHKCMKPLKRRKVFRKRNAVVEVSPAGCVVAPIFTTCEAWTKLLDDLSVADLKEAMEGLIADTSRTIPHQGETSDDGMGRVILTGYAHVGRQSTLLRFLGKLEAFSEISLQKYIDLQKEISAAKEMAWRNKFRLLNTGQY